MRYGIYLSTLTLLGSVTVTPPAFAADNPAIKPVSAKVEGAEPEEAKRVVAYIHGNVALTREQFGEYLIQRMGRERIELFVNKAIIEMACKSKGIDVTPIEIEAVIDEDCKVMNINKADFLNQVLKRYDKSLYEWKEDVIKPRLMLQKYLREKIQVTEDDLKKMFENKYGEKVKAKIIIWRKGEEKIAQKMYNEIRKGDEEFDRVARKQADPNLAAREGAIDPIARFAGPDDTVEKEAFKLQTGEVSRLIDMPFGVIVIKSLGREPANDKVNFETVKPDLHKAVMDLKVASEIPKIMEQFKKEANPVFILQPNKPKAADMEREVESEIGKKK